MHTPEMLQILHRAERCIDQLPREIERTIGAGDGDLEARDELTGQAEAADRVLERYGKA